MDVDVILCDSAKVREGLLHLLGGGVTRIWRDEYPAPLNVDLAFIISLTTREQERPHTVAVEILGEDGELIAAVNGEFSMGDRPENMDAWEEARLPLVVPLHNIAVPAAGDYRIEILMDNVNVRSIGFKVSPPPD